MSFDKILDNLILPDDWEKLSTEDKQILKSNFVMGADMLRARLQKINADAKNLCISLWKETQDPSYLSEQAYLHSEEILLTKLDYLGDKNEKKRN